MGGVLLFLQVLTDPQDSPAMGSSHVPTLLRIPSSGNEVRVMSSRLNFTREIPRSGPGSGGLSRTSRTRNPVRGCRRAGASRGCPQRGSPPLPGRPDAAGCITGFKFPVAESTLWRRSTSLQNWSLPGLRSPPT